MTVSNTAVSLKETPIIKAHQDMGAKLVDFGGWNMPIHYGSQIDEHHQVRKDAGMFDVCHMTIVDLRGCEVLDYLAKLMANDVAKIADKPGKALYSCMLNNEGGVIDDLIIYFMETAWVRVIVNSSTREKDLAWMRSQLGSMAVDLTERDDLAMIAVQGPNARELAAKALGDEIAGAQELKPFNALLINAGGENAGGKNERFVARTGYTGEDGYEIVCPNTQAEKIWRQLADAGIKPCGLGARDTLRLEAGMNLYGNDMDETQSPLESGLNWTVDFSNEKRQFNGRASLEKQKEQGLKYKFVGLVLEGKGVLRAHQEVVGGGELTSGTFSPTMQKAIGFARVPVDASETCQVAIRKKHLDAKIVKLPFVRNGKILVN